MMKLTAGPDDNRVVVLDPNWIEIEVAIRRLDGSTNTHVFLGVSQTGIPEAMPYIAIGGGGGQYYVFATFDNSHFPTLTNLENRPGKISLIVGGQEIEIKAQECVELPQVLTAANTFFERL